MLSALLISKLRLSAHIMRKRYGDKGLFVSTPRKYENLTRLAVNKYWIAHHEMQKITSRTHFSLNKRDKTKVNTEVKEIPPIDKYHMQKRAFAGTRRERKSLYSKSKGNMITRGTWVQRRVFFYWGLWESKSNPLQCLTLFHSRLAVDTYVKDNGYHNRATAIT